jgi:hypothetical protein
MRMACQKIYALKDPEILHFPPLPDSQGLLLDKINDQDLFTFAL